MKLNIYQVDAFASKLFTGNPAAVIPLKKWLPVKKMQLIAMENNLAETAFFVPSKKKNADYHLRWFTPVSEINLCGHATLASAFVCYTFLKHRKKTIVFETASGLLTINRLKKGIEMDFPSWKPTPVEVSPDGLQEALGGAAIVSVSRYRDLLVELEDEKAVKNCQPDMQKLKALNTMVIVTAPGSKLDFVSRFFAPGEGVEEDPVTGSAHSQLIPYWSEKLGKKKMKARQLSQRGGELGCVQLNEERVLMSGQAVFFMKGEIHI